MPSVTVLVPTFNRAKFLAECLESVLGQTVPPAQVIVINDGSTDNTREVLEPYMGRIEYLEKENGGKSRALNLGLSHARGDYVWIVDDDNVALPESIERLVAPLERDPGIGFSYGGYVIATTRAEDNRIEPGQEVQVPDWPKEEIFVRLMESNFIPCPLVRTACYREAGPYREDLTRSQDYEMALRLARRFFGARVDGMTFYYRQHGGLRGTATERFAAEENFAMWEEYNKRFFRQLRNDLELSEYLPKGSGGGDGKAFDRRRAYLQRMTIMAIRGLWHEMIEDLSLALEDGLQDAPLSSPEASMVHFAVNHRQCANMWLTNLAPLSAIGRRCKGPGGRGIQTELGRAMYWRLVVAWSEKRYRQAIRLGWADARLLGPAGAFRLLARKLTSRGRSSPARSGSQ